MLKYIKFYVTWIFYFGLTLSDRERYALGEMKGMHCAGVKHSIMGSYAKYDKLRKPERTFLNFKEFKKLHYPSNKELV